MRHAPTALGHLSGAAVLLVLLAACSGDPTDAVACEGVLCDPGEVCGVHTGRCVHEACELVACGEGEVCAGETGACIPEACEGVACGDGEACEGETGLCVEAPCAEDDDCAADEMCRSGECVESCETVRCAHNELCEEETGQCVTNPAFCGLQIGCQWLFEVCNEETGRCETNEPCGDCGPGHACNPHAGTCEPFMPCNETCTEGWVCNTDIGECVPEEICAEGCDLGQVCEEGECRGSGTVCGDGDFYPDRCAWGYSCVKTPEREWGPCYRRCVEQDDCGRFQRCTEHAGAGYCIINECPLEDVGGDCEVPGSDLPGTCVLHTGNRPVPCGPFKSSPTEPCFESIEIDFGLCEVSGTAQEGDSCSETERGDLSQMCAPGLRCHFRVCVEA